MDEPAEASPIPGHVLILSEPSSAGLISKMEDAIRAKVERVTHLHSSDDLDAASALWRSTDVLLAYGTFACSRDLMASNPRLRGVVSPWTGTEGFDEAAATDLGIAVANGQADENSQSVAEATVMLMLACLYDLHGSEDVLRNNLPRPAVPSARMMRGRTVGIIGFGDIGRRVADLLAPWGARLLAYNRSAIANHHVQAVDLPTLLHESDIITIHLGLNASTHHLLDREGLKLVKPDAILVNTARGAIVDEAALCDAACEGRIGRIALDVFEEEPLPPTSALRSLPNAILTPHRVGQTRETGTGLIRLAVENVTHLLKGELPLRLRNQAVREVWLRRWAKNG